MRRLQRKSLQLRKAQTIPKPLTAMSLPMTLRAPAILRALMSQGAPMIQKAQMIQKALMTPDPPMTAAAKLLHRGKSTDSAFSIRDSQGKIG